VLLPGRAGAVSSADAHGALLGPDGTPLLEFGAAPGPDELALATMYAMNVM
jgi:hypothetical protein